MELDNIQLMQDKEEPVDAVEGKVRLELSDKAETDHEINKSRCSDSGRIEMVVVNEEVPVKK